MTFLAVCWFHFTQAVRQGLVEELESLLEECSNQAAERDSQGISLLHNACRYNQAGAVDIHCVIN